MAQNTGMGAILKAHESEILRDWIARQLADTSLRELLNENEVNEQSRPAELAKRCEVMGRQTQQLANLVNDLMDVTRVTLGKVELEKKSVEVNELVSQAVEMSEAATQAKAHEVAVKLHDGPLWIQGDTTRLKQVLCNLIQNAARYTPERGNIDVSVRREAAYAVVKVADSGNQGGLGVGLPLASAPA